MASAPQISVILSTYNQPEWLSKALWGYASQQFRDFEVVVADDGSRDDTRALLDAMRPELPFPLLHEWHEDDGFRKCRILNRALMRANADYLVFSDGDCIPRADFLAVHMRHRRARQFLSGGYTKLSRAASDAIGRDEIADGRFAAPGWLKANGMAGGLKLTKLRVHGLAAMALDNLTTARPSWNGHNASGWKSDLIAANGFDERMQYGGEDCELGYRLNNSGISGKRVRYRAIVVHLDHDRPYVRTDMLEKNRLIRLETRRRRVKRTAYGIDSDSA